MDGGIASKSKVEVLSGGGGGSSGKRRADGWEIEGMSAKRKMQEARVGWMEGNSGQE